MQNEREKLEDMKTHYYQKVYSRAFAQNVAQYFKAEPNDLEIERSEKFKCNDLTVLQLVPHDLHNTYFFTLIQSLFKKCNDSMSKYALRYLKLGLFMTFI
jgi:hypothetical protein